MVERVEKSFARNTLTLSTATAVSRVTGFLRVLSLALILGLSPIANSYYLANTIPNMVYELIIGGILTSIIVPIFVEYMAKGGEDEAWNVASIITNWAIVSLGLIFLAGTFLPYYFVRIQTLRVKADDIQLAIFFFRFFAIQILFYGLAAITTGMLNTYRKFAAPAIAPIFNNVIVVMTVWLLYFPLSKSNPGLALTFLALGTTAGVLAMFIVQLPSLYKVGIRYKLTFDYRHSAIKKLLKLSLPVVIYVATNQLQLTVENNLAFPEAGGVAAVFNSWAFFQLPFGIFAVSIITALFPGLSESAALKKMDSFKKDLSLGIRSTVLIIVPSAILMGLLSKPILTFLLLWMNMGPSDVAIMSTVLSWLALGLLSYSIFMFLLKVMYSLQDTVTPTVVNILGVGLLIAVDLLLIGRMGVAAIAVGRTVFFTFMLIAFIFLLRRKIGPLGGRRIIVSTGKTLLAGAFMGLTVFYIFQLVFSGAGQSFIGKASAVFGPAASGIFVFLTASLVLKNEELIAVNNLIRSKLTGK